MQKLILTSPKRLLGLAFRAIKWHWLFYLKGKSYPLAAGFYITNTCNFRCQMCNIWRNPKKDRISLENFKKIVDDLANMGTYYLSLSGGETLLLPNLEEYLSYAKKKIPYVHFVTNGFLLDEKRAKKIATSGVDEVSISIDGLAKFHDQLRGIKGAFDHAISAINNLKTFAPKVKIVVNSVILPDNIDDLYKVVELTKNMGVLHKFQPLNQHELFENQKTKSKAWKISEKDIVKIKKFIKFLKESKHVANSRYFLSQIPNYFEGKTNQGIFFLA
ncbi:MAG: radical SAM protein [Patescibacteria group bacterium]|nr:radical SAM protein [Patescibacteria group bacterium]